MVALKIVLVESVSALHDCLSAIAPLPSTGPVHVAVDIEGVNLSRDGRISIIQLFVKGSDTVWLIDVTTLGDVAFDDVDNQARSLRGFLQDPTVTKVSLTFMFHIYFQDFNSYVSICMMGAMILTPCTVCITSH